MVENADNTGILRSTGRTQMQRLQTLLDADPEHPHIHRVDWPYRLTSSWQDQGCELGTWEKNGRLLAWAIFQPPWWNLDDAIHPGVHPDYQAQGLGKVLELAALHTMREQGLRWGYVDHASFNERAIVLASQTGFRQINRALRFYIKAKTDR